MTLPLIAKNELSILINRLKIIKALRLENLTDSSTICNLNRFSKILKRLKDTLIVYLMRFHP